MTGTLRHVVVCTVLTVGSLAVADGEPHIDPIAPEDYPALLFVQSGSRLMIATFEDDEPKIQTVIFAQSVKTTQLADTVFLLMADHYPKDRTQWPQTHFLIDLTTGRSVLLSENRSPNKLVNLYCLHSNPDEHEAVILRYGQGTEQASLLHVDLKTLQVTQQRKLPMSNEMEAFRGPHTRISPDFRRLAAITRPDSRVSGPYHFSLRVLDLETFQVTELDNKVIEQISALTSIGGTKPPLAWVNPTEILYQHMPIEEDRVPGIQTEASYTLRCVNIETGQTTEWFQKRLPLGMVSDRIQHDWLTGELRYRDFVVDIHKRNVRRYQPCYSIKSDSKGTELWFQGRRLHRAEGHYGRLVARPSRSQEHMAFLARSDSPPSRPILYALTKNMKDPVEVAGASVHTTCVRWIEDTSNLRSD